MPASHDVTVAPEETVFIIDDDPGVRCSLERLIRSAGWAVKSYESAQDFLGHMPPECVGCVLLDMQMPGLNGLRAYDHMHELGFCLPVVFLTGHGDVPSGVEAMKHGAIDFLLKPADDEVLLQTIDRAIVRHRQIRATENLKSAAQRKIASLSPREREVLNGVLQGKLNKQIAADMGIAEKTVKAHRGRVMEKLAASSVAGLVLMCTEAGVQAMHH